MPSAVGVFAPHQDDDTVGLNAIRKYVEGGHDVWVILMTTGENSGARDDVGLSLPDFIEARDDEMYRAVRAMGVRRDRLVIPSIRQPDGHLTPEFVAEVMRAWLRDHGGTDPWVKTYTNLPGGTGSQARHTDHAACGWGALELIRQGVLSKDQTRFYGEPWLINVIKAVNPGVPWSVERPAHPDRVRNAVFEYTDVDLSGGKHGCGNVSVPTIMASTKADPVSYYHVPRP